MFEALALAALEAVAKWGAEKVMGALWDHLSPLGHSVVKGILLGGAAAAHPAGAEVVAHLNSDGRWAPVPLPAAAQRLASWNAPVPPPAGAAGPSAAGSPSTPAGGARLPPQD